MKYRVWNEDCGGPDEGREVEESSAYAAAREFVETELDSFPERNNGDRCSVRVAEWAELPEDDERWPKGEKFTFKLIVEERIERA